MSEELLKPCPFCGSRAVFLKSITDIGFPNWPEEVRCMVCGATVDTIKQWNNRVDNELDRLTEALEYQKNRADANWKALCECRGEDD